MWSVSLVSLMILLVFCLSVNCPAHTWSPQSSCQSCVIQTQISSRLTPRIICWIIAWEWKGCRNKTTGTRYVTILQEYLHNSTCGIEILAGKCVECVDMCRLWWPVVAFPWPQVCISVGDGDGWGPGLSWFKSSSTCYCPVLMEGVRQTKQN